MITTRKLKLAIVSENKQEAYSFIRNEIREQNRALNIAYNHLYFEYIAKEKLKQSDLEYHEHLKKYQDISNQKYQDFLKVKEKAKENKEDEKLQKKGEKARDTYTKAQDKVYKIEKEFNQKANKTYQEVVGLAKQTRIGKLIKRQFDLHYDTVDRITSTVNAHFTTDMKAGILRGERSLRTYKKTNPLMVRVRSMKLYEEDGNYYLKWINGIIFKVVVTVANKQKENTAELKSVLSKLIEGHYKMCDSSISFDKNLIINLTVDIPTNKKNVFIPSRVVGVDLGLKIPAYVSLNDVPYIRKAIGNIKTSLKIKTQIQKQRKKEEVLLYEVRESIQKEKIDLSKDLRNAIGGKGREKKLKALERFKERERNFIKTHNHTISKNIIDFALKNNAGIIHMEKLNFKQESQKKLIRNWSYYELQQMVEYKAKREGIAVYYVDSAYTSQTCSSCGNLEEGQRESQADFQCKKCGYSVNADYNASQNIAKAQTLNDDTEQKTQQMELQL